MPALISVVGYRLSPIESGLSVIRLLFLILTCFLVLTAFASPAFAQNLTPTTNPLPPTSYQPVPEHVDPQSPVYTNLMLYNFLHGLYCIGIGQSPIGPCVEYQVQKDIQGTLKTVPVLSSVNTSGGVLGSAFSMIGTIYVNKPINSGEFLAGIVKDLGIVNEAHAQVGGSGGGVLSPVYNLWTASRNISYLFLIVIFLTIGLMIMFRHRLNPQTVITVQAALPGLIIGLILITFSYFLAAVISDLAFVGTNVVGYFFVIAQNPSPTGSATCTNPAILTECLKGTNALTVFSPFTNVVEQGAIASVIDSIWDDLANPNTNRFNPLDMDAQKAVLLLSTMLTAQFLLPFGSMFGGPGQIIAGGIAIAGNQINASGIVSLALTFIALVTLIYTMFRLLLRLINNFLSIIFLTITSPFTFLMSSLPGRQGMVTDWIRNMLCNVLAFPAVVAVFYFAAFLLGKSYSAFQVSSTAALTNTATFPLLGGFNIDFVNMLLAFGALVATPAIPDALCRTIGKVSQAEQVLSQGVQGGIKSGQGYANQVQSGTQGFVREVGRVTDDPGLVYDAGTWRRPGGVDESRGVSRPGTLTRIRASVRR